MRMPRFCDLYYLMLTIERDGHCRGGIDAADAQEREIAVRVAADQVAQQRYVAGVQGDGRSPERDHREQCRLLHTAVGSGELPVRQEALRGIWRRVRFGTEEKIGRQLFSRRGHVKLTRGTGRIRGVFVG